MGLLEWRDDFRIGIPEVDHEHRELIGMINSLHGRLLRREKDAGVAEFLGELHAQISAPFALEERIMRSQRYAEFEDHKQDHERLLDDIREIMDGYELARRYDDDALREVLDAWFGLHFRTKDARLHLALGATK